MNSKQLKYVLVLSREGNFSKAAERLNISQPSLSQYIKKIETDVGMTLFERVGGDVRLTDAGRIYRDAGERILDLERQMNAQMRDVAEHKKGSLVIGTSPFRSVGMMPMVARIFQKLYPGMHLVIEERESAELLSGTERGEFDFCLTVQPEDCRLFEYECVAEEELILVTPSDYPQWDASPLEGRKYPAIDAREISGHRFVMITENQVMQKTLMWLCSEYGVSVETAAVVKSLEAQTAMVRAGIGIALVPSGIERFCAEGEVQCYSFVQNLPRRKVVALWRKDRYLSQISRELIDAIRNIEW